eukprot:TRINITY_DN47219_c0_g1_i2.p1 TRINITY_DN47219_c0_g1~~TRINITY_DN47219_c0_g1_i2.p1  ORF type:complete len:926 (+),score=210.41 TRINITY_DN47219_c0_g1_i2:69-2846(+)
MKRGGGDATLALAALLESKSSVADDLSSFQQQLYGLVASGRGKISASDFRQAVTRALHAKDARRVLAACLMLLYVLEDAGLSAFAGTAEEAVTALDDDLLYSGLSSTATSSTTPVMSAAALRALCTLIAATAEAGRNARRTRPKLNVAGRLQGALQAHPKSPLVVEAFSQGCCAVSGFGSFTSASAAALWGQLWPLALHSDESIAHAACLSLAQLTCLARERSQVAKDQHTPDAEEAIVSACTEFERLLRSLSEVRKAQQLTALHCVRLLQLIEHLALFGESPLSAAGSKTDGRGKAGLSGAVALPLGTLFGAIDAVVSASFHSSAHAAAVTSTSPQGCYGLSDVLDSALHLAVILVDVSGSAVLIQVHRLRRLLDQLCGVTPTLRRRHCQQIAQLVQQLAERAPGILLSDGLLSRLVDACLASMQAAEETLIELTAQEALASIASASSLPPRKRKKANAAAKMEDAKSDQKMEATSMTRQECLNMFRASLSMLARLLGVGLQLVQASQLAKVCKQVVRVLWLGLVTPTHGTTAELGAEASRNVSSEASAASVCKVFCRHSSVADAFVDVIEALFSSRQLRLSASMVSAFVALLNAIANASVRRASAGRTRGMLRPASGTESAVRGRALHVREAVLALFTKTGTGSADASQRATTIDIEWPVEFAQPVVVQTLPPAQVQEADEGEDAEEEDMNEPVCSSSVSPPLLATQAPPPAERPAAGAYRAASATPTDSSGSPPVAETAAAAAVAATAEAAPLAVEQAKPAAASSASAADAAPKLSSGQGNQSSTSPAAAPTIAEVAAALAATAAAPALQAASPVVTAAAASTVVAPPGTPQAMKSPARSMPAAPPSVGNKTPASAQGTPLQKPKSSPALKPTATSAANGAVSNGEKGTEPALDVSAALELFPEADSPLPELCLDSASSDEA